MKQKKMVRGGVSTLLVFSAFLLFGLLSCDNNPGKKDEKDKKNGKVDATITKVELKVGTQTKRWEGVSDTSIKINLDSAPTKNLDKSDFTVYAKGKGVNPEKMTVTKVEKAGSTDTLKPEAGQTTNLKITVSDSAKLKGKVFNVKVTVTQEDTPTEPPKLTEVKIKKGSSDLKTITGNDLTTAATTAGLSVELAATEEGKTVKFEAKKEPTDATIAWTPAKADTDGVKVANASPVTVTAVVSKGTQKTTYTFKVSVKKADTPTEAPKLTTLVIKTTDDVTEAKSLDANGLKGYVWTQGEPKDLMLDFDKSSGKALYIQAKTADNNEARFEIDPANFDKKTTGVTFTTAGTDVTITVKQDDNVKTVYKFKVKVTPGTLQTAKSIKIGDTYALTSEDITKAAKDEGFAFKFHHDDATAVNIVAEANNSDSGVTVAYCLDYATSQEFKTDNSFTPADGEKIVKIKISKTDYTDLIYTLKLAKITAGKSNLKDLTLADTKLNAVQLTQGLNGGYSHANIAVGNLSGKTITWSYNDGNEPTTVQVYVDKKDAPDATGQDLKTAKSLDISTLTAENSPVVVRIVVTGDDGAKEIYTLKLTITA